MSVRVQVDGSLGGVSIVRTDFEEPQRIPKRPWQSPHADLPSPPLGAWERSCEEATQAGKEDGSEGTGGEFPGVDLPSPNGS
jgi:hypothetical protein